MATRTVELNQEDAALLVHVMQDHMSTLKNHIASAVEDPKHWGPDRAAEMVRELRRGEQTFKKVNGCLLRLQGVITD